MNEVQPTSGFVGLARLFWLMVGPAMLAILLISIAKKGGGWFTPQDILFLIALASLIFARWYEFRADAPTTSMGEPATPAHLRNYVVGVVILGLGAWVIANLIGNH